MHKQRHITTPIVDKVRKWLDALEPMNSKASIKERIEAHAELSSFLKLLLD